MTLTAIGLAAIASAAMVSASAEPVRYVLSAIGLVLILFGVSYQKRASDDIAH